MRTPSKIIIAVALAGLAVAGGAAFTGAGITNDAGATQFIGGQVSQHVDGATLDSVEYGFADLNHLTVNAITLTFHVHRKPCRGPRRQR